MSAGHNRRKRIGFLQKIHKITQNLQKLVSLCCIVLGRCKIIAKTDVIGKSSITWLMNNTT